MDRVLGAGAMGVVVRAWHIALQQDVAIKFLHPELAARADAAERFRREAYSAARIPSEHVPHVFDAGALEGSNVPFIVMEYLRGRDLAQELAARGPLPVGEAARYLLEACDAVGEAHARGIVHRDLKPANLFLADCPGGGQMIKVLDFGISKTLGPGPANLSITEPATLMGSPGYMSPEQLESSRNVDGRADIWSLGVILYEMVTGSLPFDGESVPQLIRAVIAGKRAMLDQFALELAPLEPVVARCLQQDRARRFQNVRELLDALAPFVPKPREIVSPLGPASAPGPMSEEPSGGASAVHHQREPVPESGWGWTHAIRRSSLGRTLLLAAVLGAAGAVVLGQGRKVFQELIGRSDRENAVHIRALQTDTVALPAPSSAPPGADPGGPASAPAEPTLGERPEATAPSALPAPAPRLAPTTPPAGSTPLPSTPRADTPRVDTPRVDTPRTMPPQPSQSDRAAPPGVPAVRPVARAAGASDEQPGESSPSPASPPAEAPARAAALDEKPAGAGNREENGARDSERRRSDQVDPYEIEDFGGRE